GVERDLAGHEHQVADFHGRRVWPDRLCLWRRDGFLEHGRTSAGEVWRDLGAGVDQTLHRLHRLLAHGARCAIELDLHDALHAVGADHDRYADIHALHAILAAEVGGTGQYAPLVLEVALGHLDRRGCGRVEGRARLQQVDDLAAALARALDDGVEALLLDP